METKRIDNECGERCSHKGNEGRAGISLKIKFAYIDIAKIVNYNIVYRKLPKRGVRYVYW